ncbi:MAG: hypothetical protein PSU94_09205 [Lacunisphaera sp.]|nr:hypothetical protein [Lacunisphaera sp.]
MRGWLAALFLSFLTAGLSPDTIDLHEYGKLTLYPVGDWNIHSEDLGDIRIRITPQDRKVNAACLLVVAPGGPDDFPTPEKLVERMQLSATRLRKSGDYAETKLNVKPFYRQSGFGCYYTLTDRKLVGKPPAPLEYKQITLGLIRLSPTVVARLQIMSDGEETQPCQQLLGMVEGMELAGK